MDIPETSLQLRARFSNNNFLAEKLSITDDRRVKRMIELLNIASQQDITQYAEEINTIVEHLPGKAGDCLEEALTRVVMYLNHISATGSALPEATRRLIDSAVRVQRDLSNALCQKARSVYTDAICYAPGPGTLPGATPSTAQSNSTRDMQNGKPQPIGKHYDPRWDPFVRMPGSQHGKFFKFPGPFFDPNTTRTNFDHFLLSETHSKLIDNTNRKIAQVRANLTETGRIELVEDAAAPAAAQSEDRFDTFAKEHGYDLDAIVIHTPTNLRHIADVVAPYVENWQVKRSSIATGLVQPEELNRAIEVMEGGRWRGIVRPVEVGCQVVLDQRISRSKKK